MKDLRKARAIYIWLYFPRSIQKISRPNIIYMLSYTCCHDKNYCFFALLCYESLTWSYIFILNAMSPCFILCQELWYGHFTCLLSIKDILFYQENFHYLILHCTQYHVFLNMALREKRKRQKLSNNCMRWKQKQKALESIPVVFTQWLLIMCNHKLR